MEELKHKAIRGGFARLSGQALNLFVRVASLVILARLLDPRDFGLVAMVTAITGVLNLFRDFGLSTATVQRSHITDEQVSALFWINVLIGIALTLLTVAAATWIAKFYQEPRLVWVAVALSAAFLFNAAGVQHTALLKRQMRFTVLSLIDAGALVLSVAVAIAMAASALGYWSLVAMAVAQPFFGSAFAWIAAKWRPQGPRLVVPELRNMLTFGGTITLNSIVVYCAYNLEKVLLGRYWGADVLGIYGRAYQLVNIPAENLNAAVGDVAFSALSRVRDDPARLKSYFLKGYSLVIAITVPITVACALLADDLVPLLLGPRWAEAIPIFRLLAPTILIYAMINPMWWLLMSLGLAGRSLKIGLVLSPLVIASYILGLPYGPKGVALAYSLVMTLWLIPHILWCIQGTNIYFRDIAIAVMRPFLSAVIAAASTAALLSLPWPSNPLLHVALGSTSLICAYLGLLLYAFGQKRFYLELARSLVAKQPAQGSALA
jgi:O-antigen/teichoic acid export membrane protein